MERRVLVLQSLASSSDGLPFTTRLCDQETIRLKIAQRYALCGRNDALPHKEFIR